MHIVRCGVQEQQAEATRIAGERRRLQQEQAAATARLQAEQKKQIKEEQLRMKRMQQVCQVPHGLLPSWWHHSLSAVCVRLSACAFCHVCNRGVLSLVFCVALRSSQSITHVCNCPKAVHSPAWPAGAVPILESIQFEFLTNFWKQ